MTEGYLVGTFVVLSRHGGLLMVALRKARVRSPALKSTHQIRRERLEQLLAAFAHDPSEVGLPELGRYARFAEKVGTSAKSFSHVRNGRRNIGSDLARRLESAFGRPRNWMDTPDLEISASARTEMQEVLAQLLLRAAEIDAVETHRALLSIIDRRNVP
jgi:plasmid maintenance system antidote protein VapI